MVKIPTYQFSNFQHFYLQDLVQTSVGTVTWRMRIVDFENNESICTLAGKMIIFIRSEKLDNLNLVTGEYIFISTYS
jgi:hypothetical protein